MNKRNNMKTYLIICLLVIVAIFSFSPSNFVYAVEANNPGGNGIITNDGGKATTPIPPLTNPIKVSNVQEALFLTVDLMIFIGTILAVLAFIFIGFKFVMAQGNDTELSNAKKWFMYAAIGTAVLISSKVIVEVIKNTFVSTGIVNESLFKKQ